MTSPRRFEDSEAVRETVPLFIGLVGPSGSGKTFSALRLAAGMQRVTGGDIFGIDTEARRMSHYADQFKFRRIDFEAPFDPLSYLAAVEHCVRKGARNIIVDSTSHMHEGIGGTLEAHEAELDRIAGNDFGKRDRCKMLAWQRPKADLRRFLNSILQLRANVIFCFRAKEKIKLVSGRKEPEFLGFMPIAGDEMIYEMTVNCLLYPGSKGVPTWNPEEIGEKTIVKLPGHLIPAFGKGRPLSEDIGEKLALWSSGGKSSRPVEAAPQADPEARSVEAKAVETPLASKAAEPSTGFEIALGHMLEGTGLDGKVVMKALVEWATQRQLMPSPDRLPDGRYKARSLILGLDKLWSEREEQVAAKIEEFIDTLQTPAE